MELPVRVTLLGEKPLTFDASLVSLQGRNLALRSTRRLDLRVPLRLENGGRLWMGEVDGVRAEDGGWLVTMRIEHALRDTAELTRLADRFVGKLDTGEESASTPALPAVP